MFKVVTLLVLLIVGGCASAPAREAGTDRLYDPSLVGTWSSGRSRWTLARAGDFGYALTLADPPTGGASPALPVDLVKVDQHLYLLPAGSDDLRQAVSNVLVRLDRAGPDRLEVAMLDLTRLAELTAAPPASSPTSLPATLPASRPAVSLRGALAEYGGAAGLFVPLGELRRVR